MNNGDKVMVYAADNRWHECSYIGKSPNEGHHIIYKNAEPWECGKNMVKEIKSATQKDDA